MQGYRAAAYMKPMPASAQRLLPVLVFY